MRRGGHPWGEFHRCDTANETACQRHRRIEPFPSDYHVAPPCLWFFSSFLKFFSGCDHRQPRSKDTMAFHESYAREGGARFVRRFFTEANYDVTIPRIER